MYCAIVCFPHHKTVVSGSLSGDKLKHKTRGCKGLQEAMTYLRIVSISSTMSFRDIEYTQRKGEARISYTQAVDGEGDNLGRDNHRFPSCHSRQQQQEFLLRFVSSMRSAVRYLTYWGF